MGRVGQVYAPSSEGGRSAKWAPEALIIGTGCLVGECRVCGGAIGAREPRWMWRWAMRGVAHVECGFYLASDPEAQLARALVSYFDGAPIARSVLRAAWDAGLIGLRDVPQGHLVTWVSIHVAKLLASRSRAPLDGDPLPPTSDGGARLGDVSPDDKGGRS